MIAELHIPVTRHAYRTDRAPSRERSYLCTFLNEQGERVDVFENLGGETFFLVHHRENAMNAKRAGMVQHA